MAIEKEKVSQFLVFSLCSSIQSKNSSITKVPHEKYMYNKLNIFETFIQIKFLIDNYTNSQNTIETKVA